METIAASATPHPPGAWFKSGRSAPDANCVEVRYLPEGGVEVRNSKRPERGSLIFTDDEFDAWVGGAKDGDFDR
jgi:hypothetical protein